MLRFTSIRAAVERCDCSLLFVDTVRTTVNYNHSVQEKVCTQCVPAAEMCALGRIARRMDWALHAASYKTLWAAVAKIYGVHRSCSAATLGVDQDRRWPRKQGTSRSWWPDCHTCALAEEQAGTDRDACRCR